MEHFRLSQWYRVRSGGAFYCMLTSLGFGLQGMGKQQEFRCRHDHNNDPSNTGADAGILILTLLFVYIV